jgi:WhiB family transcriptional regulator, redox-sensing transcriptional regulator
MNALAVPARLDWRHRAACRTVDADLFFPDADPGTEAYRLQAQAAKDVCAGCPVRWPCGQYAVDSYQKHGIWAGLDEGERHLEGRRRQRRRRERVAA